MSTILDNIISGEEANKNEAERIEKAKVLKNALDKMIEIETIINNGDEIYYYNIQINEIGEQSELKLEVKFKSNDSISLSYSPFTSTVLNDCVLNDVSIITADIQKIIDEL